MCENWWRKKKRKPVEVIECIIIIKKMNYSEQILKARFAQLPEDVRKAITATPWKDKLAQISRKHNLHIDQEGHLGEEAVIVMFGLDHPDNLVYNIAQNVEVSKEKAEVIAEDLNNEIFLKVRESLKKIFEEREEGDSKSSFLGGSLSADEAGLLDEKKEGDRSLLASSFLGKKGGEERETLNREDVLRDIEDKEHHNLPTTSMPELHLETKRPSEIIEKSVNLPSEQISFPKITNDVKTEKHDETKPLRNSAELEREQKIFKKVNQNAEQDDTTADKINIRAEQAQKQPLSEETIRTMEKDIFKVKMSGTVSLPKETVEVNDFLPKLNKKSMPNGDDKFDPYKESVG